MAKCQLVFVALLAVAGGCGGSGGLCCGMQAARARHWRPGMLRASARHSRQLAAL
jgi:hypothetical protein